MSYILHAIGNFHDCPRELLERVEVVKKMMYDTIVEATLHPVGEIFHQYEPYGVTGVFLLAESHLSIHTWPEYDYVAVDVFTCSEGTDPRAILEIMRRKFRPGRYEEEVMDRGKLLGGKII